jgi:peptide/nickel transport system permease protein
MRAGRSLLAAIAAAFLVLLALACLLAPWLAPHAETAIVGEPWASWSASHRLGTDSLGRDMITRLLYGARNTIAIALVASLISFAIAVVLAFAAATYRGWVDQLLSRTVDVLMSIPTLIFALVVLSALGSSVPVLIGTMVFLDATRFYRLARALAVDVMVLEFVETARLRGEGFWWFLRREILPNVSAPLLAELGLRFSFAALFLSSLSFLGLGVQPPAADLGSMVKENVNAIAFGLAVPLLPALLLAAMTIAVNVLVDWHNRRDAARTAQPQ